MRCVLVGIVAFADGGGGSVVQLVVVAPSFVHDVVGLGGQFDVLPL